VTVGTRGRALAVVAIFFAVLGLLAVRATHLRIADTLLDPVGRVDAQDEAMYAQSAMRMAAHGGWLTPMYQARIALNKPPLLAWAAGASAKVFGTPAWALRLPVMLAAALTACLAFLWRRNLAAVLLLVSDRLWFVLSTLCLTDGLLAAFVTGAAYCLWRDPKLESRAARWSFALLTAAAVMVKSVAGALPVFILLAYCALAKRGERPAWRRVIGVLAAAGAMVVPWCLYQLAVHPKWFWSEFVLSEILTYGVSSPIQTTHESQIWFYLKRLFTMDPVLAALAIPAIWYSWRRRETVLLAWIAVVFGTAFLWSYRNVTYLAPAIPALAILAGQALSPAGTNRRKRLFPLLLAVVFIVKVALPAQPWGVELRPGVLHPSVTLLDDYARLHRGRELILVDPFEGFYSSVLPLSKVRYCFVAPGGVPPQPPLDLHYLGILVSADEFAAMDRLRPVWRSRLREWGLDSDEPIATAIVARSREEVGRLMEERPEADFLVPEGGGFRLKLAK
jgi:4-amino-4-deoxy-L-arabinose transferase-like glycosyltransferase